MSIKPLADRVLIEPAPADEVSRWYYHSRHRQGKTVARYYRCSG